MTWRRLVALRKIPSSRLMIAAYLGVGSSQKEEPKQYMDFDAMADFMLRTGGKIEGVGRA